MPLRTPRIAFLAAGVPGVLGRADHDARIHFLHRQREQGAFITDRPVDFMSQQACTLEKLHGSTAEGLDLESWLSLL